MDSAVMSTPASSLNWWYIEGRRRRMYSGVRRLAMSRNTPPCGLPRPFFTSELIDRATSSRGNSSGGRRLLMWSSYQRSASASLSAVSAANMAGMYSNMKRLPSELRSTPPSPRTPSVTRIPRTESGHTMPVGWNCTHSMSMTSAPAHSAMAWPSPTDSHELEVYIHDLPIEPVASTVALAEKATISPVG